MSKDQDPFDGGVLDIKSGMCVACYRPEWSDDGGLDMDAPALGVIAALANLGRIWPWGLLPVTERPKFVVEEYGVGRWWVYDDTDARDTYAEGLTEAQAHAIAAVLNGEGER